MSIHSWFLIIDHRIFHHTNITLEIYIITYIYFVGYIFLKYNLPTILSMAIWYFQYCSTTIIFWYIHHFIVITLKVVLLSPLMCYMVYTKVDSVHSYEYHDVMAYINLTQNIFRYHCDHTWWYSNFHPQLTPWISQSLSKTCWYKSISLILSCHSFFQFSSLFSIFSINNIYKHI